MSTGKAAHPLLQPLRGALAAADLVRVREILEPLSLEERAALRREAMPEVTSGLKASVERLQNAWQIPSSGSLTINDAFTARLARPNAALRAYRLASVGLGLKKDVDSALFSTRLTNFWGGDWSLEPQLTLPYQAGLLLLSRDEPWRDDTLYRILDGEEGPGMASDGAFELALRLLQDGRGPRDRVLAAAARQARRLAFRLWAQDGRVFPWGTDLGRAVLWAALEARDEPLLASIDNASMGGRLVQRLVEMTASGQLERASLIALALGRLAESSRPFEANWWGRLLEALELSDAEWEQHSEAVLDLIGAPNPRAVTAGLGAATRLVKRRAVEPASLAPVLALAVSSPVAGSAKSAVALLRRCAEQDESLRLEALTSALGALQHPKSAVQDALLSWLEAEEWWREDAEAHYAVAEAAVAAPAAAAARLDPLLAREGGPEPAAQPAPAEEPEAGDLEAEIESRIAAEADPARREWLVALRAALDGAPLPPYDPDLRPRWRNGPGFTVPGSAEETAQLLLRVTVGRLTAEEWERINAGVRRPLTPDEKQMLPRLLDPILRLRPQLDGTVEFSRTPAGWQDLWTVLRLAEAWIGRPWTPFPAGTPGAQTRQVAPSDRKHQLHATLAALERGDGLPALGTPTQESGWLDPLVFAERLLQRGDLPREELWDLSSALYRLAPDDPARLEAWKQLAPHRSRWGSPAELMLAAALAPGEEGERGQVELVNWYRGQAGGFKQIRKQADKTAGWLRSILGVPAPEPAKGQVVDEVQLRLLTSALRCRHGMGGIAVLEFIRGLLPQQYHLLLQGGSATPETVEVNPFLAAMEGAGYDLTQVIPELAPNTPGFWVNFHDPVLAFPPVAHSVAQSTLESERQYFLLMTSGQAFQALRRADCPLIPLLPLIVRRLPDDKEDAALGVQLLGTGLGDGRLRLRDLIDAFVPGLTRKEAKPRALISALELLIQQYPPARDAAVVMVEDVLGGPLEGITPADRVRLLEVLLQWRSETGTRVESADTIAALEAMAAKGKNNRAGSLARQLLDLPGRRPGGSRRALLLHDVEVTLRGSDVDRCASNVQD